MQRQLAALALITGTAWATTPRDVTWTRAAVATLPVFAEDVGAAGKAEQLQQLAELVADSEAPPEWPKREWWAVELLIARHESTMALRIQNGACRAHECDSGKAAGLWQQHEFSWNTAVWSALPGNLPLQVSVANDSLRRAWLTCKGSKVPRVQATISAYAGQQCGAQWKGLDARLDTFTRLMRVKTGDTK